MSGRLDQRARQDDPAITLGILDGVERDSTVTQRRLAGDLGIALGLANAYLKRAARKGLIKVRQVPARRYAYYLTPKGFAEKARLTAEYFSSSLEFYRAARAACAALLAEASAAGQQKLLLLGSGDLTEVMLISAADAEVEVLAILDPTRASIRCAGRPVLHEVSALPAALAPQAIVLTAPDPDGALMRTARALAERFGLPADAILRPDLPGLRAASPARIAA
jgi:DNA-binding MarR family transcriptional regulator